MLTKYLKLGKGVGLFLCAVVALFLSSVPTHGSTVEGGGSSQSPIIIAEGQQGTAYVDSGGHATSEVPVVEVGQSRTIYGPHHAGAVPHNGHYFAETDDDHHFAWLNSVPTSPGPIDLKYDFRSEDGSTNSITAAQKANAVAAMNAWSAATGGKVIFTQDTGALASSIINIGTGDLAAVGFTSGPGSTLGVGGGSFSHGPPGWSLHNITKGVAWQDKDDTWDTTIGNGDPGGTFDYFTVVAQEIGHALGLGHTSGASDIMNGSYSGEKTALSSADIAHIISIYGVIPEPASAILLGVGAMLVVVKRRRA